MTRYISRSLAGTKTYGGSGGKEGEKKNAPTSFSPAPPWLSAGRRWKLRLPCSNWLEIIACYWPPALSSQLASGHSLTFSSASCVGAIVCSLENFWIRLQSCFVDPKRTQLGSSDML
ncbi:hypothetical protein CDAR_615561 [Caerostris darwini]|uniref:Uncharacterized protein n=1 Tax=Caerostris darwini TaxID=1538125 RepID=A0AAV4RZF3_9ARAC|nr:hypothetical protein CDAR_615561 [Caerostris darwini]